MQDSILPMDTSPQALLDAIRMALQLDEGIDSLLVRRDLAAASIGALGDCWDNEVDLEWQDFALEVG